MWPDFKGLEHVEYSLFFNESSVKGRHHRGEQAHVESYVDHEEDYQECDAKLLSELRILEDFKVKLTERSVEQVSERL